ncbi:hypothetical protein Tco_1307297 [Tanacetum coccineum]
MAVNSLDLTIMADKSRYEQRDGPTTSLYHLTESNRGGRLVVALASGTKTFGGGSTADVGGGEDDVRNLKKDRSLHVFYVSSS